MIDIKKKDLLDFGIILSILFLNLKPKNYEIPPPIKPPKVKASKKIEELDILPPPPPLTVGKRIRELKKPVLVEEEPIIKKGRKKIGKNIKKLALEEKERRGLEKKKERKVALEIERRKRVDYLIKKAEEKRELEEEKEKQIEILRKHQDKEKLKYERYIKKIDGLEKEKKNKKYIKEIRSLLIRLDDGIRAIDKHEKILKDDIEKNLKLNRRRLEQIEIDLKTEDDYINETRKIKDKIKTIEDLSAQGKMDLDAQLKDLKDRYNNYSHKAEGIRRAILAKINYVKKVGEEIDKEEKRQKSFEGEKKKILEVEQLLAKKRAMRGIQNFFRKTGLYKTEEDKRKEQRKERQLIEERNQRLEEGRLRKEEEGRQEELEKQEEEEQERKREWEKQKQEELVKQREEEEKRKQEELEKQREKEERKQREKESRRREKQLEELKAEGLEKKRKAVRTIRNFFRKAGLYKTEGDKRKEEELKKNRARELRKQEKLEERKKKREAKKLESKRQKRNKNSEIEKLLAKERTIRNVKGMLSDIGLRKPERVNEELKKVMLERHIYQEKRIEGEKKKREVEFKTKEALEKIKKFHTAKAKKESAEKQIDNKIVLDIPRNIIPEKEEALTPKEIRDNKKKQEKHEKRRKKFEEKVKKRERIRNKEKRELRKGHPFVHLFKPKKLKPEEEIKKAIDQLKAAPKKIARPKVVIKGQFQSKVVLDMPTAVPVAKTDLNDIEYINQRIADAKESLLDFDLERAKKIYIDVLKTYNTLSNENKKKAYGTIKGLYDARKNAERTKR